MISHGNKLDQSALRRAVIVLLPLLCLHANHVAGETGNYQAGMEAFQRGDYVAALRKWHPLAEQGHAEAQFNLGVMYESGSGVPKDHIKAVKWYRKAAEQGNAGALSAAVVKVPESAF